MAQKQKTQSWDAADSPSHPSHPCRFALCLPRGPLCDSLYLGRDGEHIVCAAPRIDWAGADAQHSRPGGRRGATRPDRHVLPSSEHGRRGPTPTPTLRSCPPCMDHLRSRLLSLLAWARRSPLHSAVCSRARGGVENGDRSSGRRPPNWGLDEGVQRCRGCRIINFGSCPRRLSLGVPVS